MTENEVDELFRALRREYLSEGRDRLAELRADLTAFRDGSPGAVAALKTHFHRLAGSGGSYGFPDVSAIAKKTELWLGTGPPSGSETVARLDDAIARLEAAFKSSKT
jgi:hypothetical protein